MMRKLVFALTMAACAVAQGGMAQQAPVAFINELHNEAAQFDEWTEIVVAQDNLDLRGYFFGDNNNSTSAWRAKKTFKSVPLFQHLRAGTYIVIHHPDGVNSCPSQDVDASDGYLELCANDDNLFDGGDATTLFLSSQGDFVHLVDPSGHMVQGMGFDDQPGTSVEGGSCNDTRTTWRNINNTVNANRPCGNFLFLRDQIPDVSSLIYTDSALARLVPNPGLFIQAASPSALLDVGTSSMGHGNTAKNILLMRRLRQPAWPLPSSTCTRVLTGPQPELQLEVPFTPIVDANPADHTLRYLVVRYPAPPLSNEPSPTDGIAYTAGAMLGTGTIMAILPNSATVYQDPTGGANTFYYRIYAFRYSLTSGVSTPDRGPAYNENQFATAGPGIALALSGPSSICPGDTALFTVGYHGQLELVYSSTTPGLGIIARDTTVKVFLIGSVAANTAITLRAGFGFSIPECVSEGVKTFVVRYPSLAVNGDTAINFGDTAILHLVRPGTIVQVNPPDILHKLNDSTYSFRDTVTRSFTLTSSDAGTCNASATISIRVRSRPVIPIPLNIPNLVVRSSKFPNNKSFIIQGASVERLNVYNRWGSLVLDALAYDGTWVGNPGTYFFFADLTLPDGTSQRAKGWVEVVD